MKKQFRRIVSLCLALVLCMACLLPLGSIRTTAAPAPGSESDGTTPTGIAVSDAESFGSMSADGNYYLTADIVISTAFAGAFTGTIDGNGHTVTTTVPLFTEFNGTVKDLTIAGSVKGTGDLGALASTSSGFCAYNVQNTATVSGSDNVGGLVGNVSGSITLYNCENGGAVSGGTRIGGLVGYCSEGTANHRVVGCVNTGNVSGSTTGAAGLIGIMPGSAQFTDCFNYGTVSAGATQVAGLVGSVGQSGSRVFFARCGNFGDIRGAKNFTGGLVGYMYGSSYQGFVGCFNAGDVYSSNETVSDSQSAAGIVAYFNQTGIYLSFCYNAGSVTTAGANKRDLFYNNNAAGCAVSYLRDNYYLTREGIAENGDVYKNGSIDLGDVTHAFSASALSDGTLTAALNEAAGTTLYYDMEMDGKVFPFPRATEECTDGIVIMTAAELCCMREDGRYYLGTDINGVTMTYPKTFTGTLDGRGHTVTSSVPLFQTLNGTVRNLTIAGTVTGTKNVGALAVESTASVTLENVHNTASVAVTAAGMQAAGLIPVISGTGTVAIFTDCSNSGTVTATSRAAGLVASLNNTGATTATRCRNSGNVTGETYAGGIFGYVIPNITATDCVNTGDITGGKSYVGGVVGNSCEKTYRSVYVRCGNYGTVRGSGVSTGGVIGYMYGTAGNSVTACYNLGTVSGSGTYSSGILGYVNSSATTISYCYSAGEITSGTNRRMIVWNNNATGSSAITNNYYLENTYEAYQNGTQTTKATAFASSDVGDGALCGVLSAAGTGVNWHQMTAANVSAPVPAATTAIYTAAEFAAMSASGTYTLAADITIDTTYASAFTGTLDGNGHTITTTVPVFKEFKGTARNLTVAGSVTKATHAGAFAVNANDAAILLENVHNTASVTVTGTDQHAGGLFGYIMGSGTSTFINCSNSGTITATKRGGGIAGSVTASGLTTATNCQNSGNVSAVQYGGGIFALVEKSNTYISGCVNSGNITVSGGYAGGVLGYSAKSLTLTDAVNHGEITSTGGYAGGVVAYAGSANDQLQILLRCVNYGTVNSSNGVGGIVGYIYGGTGGHLIAECCNLGNVKGTGTYACGILGYINSSFFTLRNCYSAGDVSGATNVRQLFYNNNGNGAYVICTGNRVLEGGAPALRNVKDVNAGVKTFTASQLYSGGLTRLLNDGAGVHCYWQTANTPAGSVPTPESNRTAAIRFYSACGDKFMDNAIEGAGYSVSVSGEISVNFYLYADNARLDDYTVQTTKNGVTSTGAFNLPTKNGYRISVGVAPAQMDEEVTLTIKDGSGSTVYSDAFSVKAYAEAILKNPANYDAKLVSLCEAMLFYGAAAEKYFEGSTDIADLTQFDPGDTDFSAIANKYAATGHVSGINGQYVTIDLQQKTTIVAYFLPEDPDTAGDYTFEWVSGDTVLATLSPVPVGEYWRVAVVDVASTLLDDAYTLRITDGAGNQATLTYSVLSYVGHMLNETSDDNLTMLLKTLYMYHLAASAYFNA